MSIKKLNAENAVIKTASVEVKTLTISGKQVTLAVFRQLPIKHIISDVSYDLLGMSWGTVNYSLPDKPYGDHVQVVWQEGSKLYRCWVTERFCDWQEIGSLIKESKADLDALYHRVFIFAVESGVPIDF